MLLVIVVLSFFTLSVIAVLVVFMSMVVYAVLVAVLIVAAATVNVAVQNVGRSTRRKNTESVAVLKCLLGSIEARLNLSGANTCVSMTEPSER
mmetsp:Transcript_451/g.1145  ORF Transcript_451/g.1145 Transcript_451/m.1145 type:complete len:93 (-) Transcript_451:1695-1973(-)